MSAVIKIESEAELDQRKQQIGASCLIVLYFYTQWTVFKTSMTGEVAAIATQYPATTPQLLFSASMVRSYPGLPSSMALSRGLQ